MKAYVINNFGNHDVFELAEMPIPKIDSKEVLIKVKATSVNPVDYKFRRGDSPLSVPPFPTILHFDVAGVVEKIGHDVKHLKVGDEVFGMAGGFKTRQGCLAEYVAAPAGLIHLKPKNLSFAQAAAVPLAGLTAWEAIIMAVTINTGDKVLIHAGTGGVGHFAVQFAKMLGATVYATVSSEQKGEIARNLGADFIINYHKETTEDYIQKYTHGNGFDVVVDTVGSDTFDKSIIATRLRGHLVSILGRSNYDLLSAGIKALHIHLINVTHPLSTNMWQEEHHTALRKMTELFEKNKLKVLINDKIFKMHEVSHAHLLAESGKNLGKVCIEW